MTGLPGEFLSRTRHTVRHRLMVISAKGGVGKSTLTVNLAAAIRARGRRVGIFDADIHGPNIPSLLGIRQTRGLTDQLRPEAMIAVEARVDSTSLKPIPPFERYGIQLMSLALIVGESQPINPISEVVGAITLNLINRADWDNLDVLLIDMPPGTGEPLNTLLKAGLIDGALVVTTREQLAHLDNTRLVSLLGSKGIPIIGIVENMSYMVCPHCGEKVEMYPALTEQQGYAQNIPVLGDIPFHPQFIRQNYKEAPLPLSNPELPEARLLLDLADRVLESVGALGSRA